MGNSTFIVLKVPTSGIVRVNAEDKVDTEGTKKVILPEYQVFYYTEQLYKRMKETYEMCRIIKQLMTSNSMDTRIYYATSDNLFFDWLTSLVTFFDKTLYSPRAT
jgi:hypothetical protein